MIGQKGFKKTHMDKAVRLLNTPMLIDRPVIPEDQYKIVLTDHLFPMTSSDWEVESKYAGQFVYKKVYSDMGDPDIIRIDRVEVDEAYKEIALKAELCAAKKFTGNENSYYENRMDEHRRLMSYAFVCDKWSLYYFYKSDGFERQVVRWLSHEQLNPKLYEGYRC